MYEEIEKLNHCYWLSADESLTLFFQEIKGLITVKVKDRKTQGEGIYLLLPTLKEDAFAFDTPSGHFIIGICEGGNELYLSPIGKFLYPWGQTGFKAQDMSVVSPAPTDITV